MSNITINSLVKIRKSGTDNDFMVGIVSQVMSEPYYQIKTIPIISDENKSMIISSEEIVELELFCPNCGGKITEEGRCVECGLNINRDLYYYTRQCWKDLGVLSVIVEASDLISAEDKKKFQEYVDGCERCECCGRPIFKGKERKTNTDTYACPECAGRHYYICENCGVFIRHNGEFYTGNRGHIFCSYECMDEVDPWDFSRKLAYNAKPPVRFLGSKDKNNLYLGVEVEVDSDNYQYDDEDEDEYYDRKESVIGDCVYNIWKTSRDVFCKHDGSLNFGFEFVTHPATLEYHKTKLNYDDVIKVCENRGFSGDYSTAGLHIHASKAFFDKDKSKRDILPSLENAVKLEILFERFWGNMLKLANRDFRRAARWAKRRDFFECNNQKITKKKLQIFIDRMYEDRYTAINITNNPTIEFRLFSGSTNKEYIFAMLEFVDYMCRFVKGEGFDVILNITWEELFAEVAKSDDYKYLKAWMAINHLLPKIEEVKVA